MPHEPGATFHPETLAIMAGYDPASASGAAKPPVYLTSTFVYESAEQARAIHEAYFRGTGPMAGQPAYIYARLSHPNLAMLETRLAAIDGAQSAAVFASGMAAHSAIALTHLRPGDSVLHSRPIYGGTEALYNQMMPHFGVHAVPIGDGCDGDHIRAQAELALAQGPLALIVIETPANPTAALTDIALVVAIADEIGARTGRRPLVVCDNTFLAPFAQRPVELGVDLTMTSLTKYCGGHSDLLAGGVSGRAEVIAPLLQWRTMLGSHCDPFTCWLVLRSLESVAVRSERAMSNAALVAAFLRDHGKVAGVTFLGFLPKGTPQRMVYDRQCQGAGSTFSFHLHGGEAEAFRLLDGLRLVKQAVSLGGSETLACHSATTTHYNVPAEARAAGGITEGTIRLSVGIEHPDDLIADFAQALEHV
jgi:cystathionine gamma-synthase/methionine-gamma-lyase